MKEGTIVDATIIAAPSSTKNAERKRDSEMHQTKKGNQWHFGMKAHVAVDAESGLVQRVIGVTRRDNRGGSGVYTFEIISGFGERNTGGM